MLCMKSLPLELRGVQNRLTKGGKAYYLLNVENEDGMPYQLYCPNSNALPQGLKKGDMVTVTFAYTVFDRQERVYVTQVEKVG